MLNRRFFLSAAAVAAIGLTQGSLIAADAAAKDIVTTAVEAGSFKTLAAALKAAGLVETLQSKGPFTVLAPTDEAFANLPAGTVEMLLKPENKARLVSVLTYHVVAGNVAAAQVVKLNAAATVNGQRVNIKVEDGHVRVDQATVVKADIHCSNGIIHVIDQVLLPSADSIPATASKAGTFKTLLAAAKAAGLVEVLAGDQPLTVFAPTDEAFAKLPAGTGERLRKPDQFASYLRMAAEKSLARLGTDHFDALYLHNPDSVGYSSDAAWKGMAALKSAHVTSICWTHWPWPAALARKRFGSIRWIAAEQMTR